MTRPARVATALLLLPLLGAMASAGAQDVPAPPPMPEGLPDFSWAGYHSGESAPPVLEPTFDVRDFGARGDGKRDDTEAIRAAIAAAAARSATPEGRAGPASVVHLPKGRYLLTGVLTVSADRVVLKGDGAGATVLVCPRSLADMHGPSPSWSWSGGMIQLAPAAGGEEAVGEVRAVARAGDAALAIALEEKAAPPRASEWLELRWHNDTGEDTLLDHLHGGVIERGKMGKEMREAEGPRVREWVQVTAVEPGEAGALRVTIGQPLRIDARPAWRPRLVRRPHLVECGVEGLTIEFPETEYPGHLRERGYNGISIGSAIDCWVRDIETVRADSGVFANVCKRVTLDGLTIRGRMMHHGISMSWSSDCLATNFRIEAPHVHGTTISWSAHGNVFSRGYGRDLAMDAHRACSFMNLHTDITIAHGGRPKDPFRSGGSAPRGPHSARQNVYWYVRHEFGAAVEGPVRIGPVHEWPLGVFVGWHGNRAIDLRPLPELKQQVLSVGEPHPVADLHAHQRARRLGR